MDANAVFGLISRGYVSKYQCLDTPFMRQLINLSQTNSSNATNPKMLNVVLKDKVNVRGEVALRGISAAEKSVIDICKLTPLVGENNERSLLDEVANFRLKSLGFTNVSKDFAKKHNYALFVDYMLSTCLCYVEVFGKNKVDKFLATRNRFIASEISGLGLEGTKDLASYLATYKANYEAQQLKVVKIVPRAKDFKLSKPRGYLDLKEDVKITPVFFMTSFIEGINEVMAHSIVKFTYIKDNKQSRDFLSTVSVPILSRAYGAEMTQNMISNIDVKYDRGYVKLPELGISKYDETGCRALNLTRITSIEIVKDFDTRYIDVDFSRIETVFYNTIERINDIKILKLIYADLTNKPLVANSLVEAKSAVISDVEGKVAIGTTTALRMLHDYMVRYKNIFNTYNDGKIQEFKATSFNLGVD